MAEETSAVVAPAASTTAPAASASTTVAAPAAAVVVEAPATAAAAATVVAPASEVAKPAVPDAAAAPAAASAVKPVEAPAAKTGAPETYEDFTAPEGAAIVPEVLGAFKDAAKALNLSQADAQALVDKVVPGMLKNNAASVQSLAKQVSEGWLGASKSDTEFGGEQFDANLAVAKRTLESFGTPALTKFLNDSGLGNHPEMIRWAYKIGQQLGPDGKFVTASASSSGVRAPESVLWPKMAASA